MNINLESVREAIENGEVSSARRMLQHLLSEDPNNYRAWLWLAGITNSSARRQYVQRAFAIKPDDPTVIEAVAWAENADDTQGSAERIRAIAAGAGMTTAPKTAQASTQAAPAAESREDNNMKSFIWLRRIGILALLLLVLLLSYLIFQTLRTDGQASLLPEPIARLLGSDSDAVASNNTQGIVDNGTQSKLYDPADPAQQSDQALLPVVADGVEAADEGVAQVDAGEEVSAETQPETAPPIEAPAAEVAEAPIGVIASTDPYLTSILAPIPTNVPAPAEPAPKNIAAKQPEQPRQAWTPTPMPTATPAPTATPVPTAAPLPTAVPTADPSAGITDSRWIDVNLTSQTLTAYEDGTPVLSTLIASGLWGTPTVTGQFRIYYRLESQNMSGYHLGFNYYIPDVPYVMYFYEDFALHGAPWNNNLGTPGSHGCVNMAPTDAQWIWNFSDIGTLVNVHY